MLLQLFVQLVSHALKKGTLWANPQYWALRELSPKTLLERHFLQIWKGVRRKILNWGQRYGASYSKYFKKEAPEDEAPS